MRARLVKVTPVRSPKSGSPGLDLEFEFSDGSGQRTSKSLWFSGGATPISEDECAICGVSEEMILAGNFSSAYRKVEVDLKDDGKGGFYINAAGSFGVPVEASDQEKFRREMAAAMGLTLRAPHPAPEPPGVDTKDGIPF